MKLTTLFVLLFAVIATGCASSSTAEPRPVIRDYGTWLRTNDCKQVEPGMVRCADGKLYRYMKFD